MNPTKPPAKQVIHRKPPARLRNRILTVRVTDAELEAIREEAIAQSLTLSEYVISACLRPPEE